MHVLTNFDNDSLNPFISACDKGYFGTACNETCGQCDELEQCYEYQWFLLNRV